jgi:hypothetical protein
MKRGEAFLGGWVWEEKHTQKWVLESEPCADR